MSKLNSSHDDPLKYFSIVAKLVHYTSKFSSTNDDGRNLKPNSSNRVHRLSSSTDFNDKLVFVEKFEYLIEWIWFRPEAKRFRLAPLWPEWNETEVNAESWDTGNVKKKETPSIKSRADAKAHTSHVRKHWKNIQKQRTRKFILQVGHVFEDPDGKIELPSSLKIEQWKRPIDYLPPEKVKLSSDFNIWSCFFSSDEIDFSSCRSWTWYSSFWFNYCKWTFTSQWSRNHFVFVRFYIWNLCSIGHAKYH